MVTKVTMNLTDDELTLVDELRSSLKMSTKTGTVGFSLRLAALIADGLKKGKQLVFLDANGLPETLITIPGISHDC